VPLAYNWTIHLFKDYEVTALAYVLICDDHPLVGRGIRELLKGHPQIVESVCTSSEHECFQYIESHGAPIALILDFWLRGNASEHLVIRLRDNWPEVPILMISSDDDPVVQLKCEQWGTQGFISKQASPMVVVNAVTAVIRGLDWFEPPNPDVLGSSIRKNQWPITAAELGLTTRQGQILAMIIEGLPNKRIALNLNVAEATVKEHVTIVLQKLGVKSRVQAISKLQTKRFVV
jgi:DNA-binding NarL/FixJ family response regulator